MGEAKAGREHSLGTPTSDCHFAQNNVYLYDTYIKFLLSSTLCHISPKGQLSYDIIRRHARNLRSVNASALVGICSDNPIVHPGWQKSCQPRLSQNIQPSVIKPTKNRILRQRTGYFIQRIQVISILRTRVRKESKRFWALCRHSKGSKCMTKSIT